MSDRRQGDYGREVRDTIVKSGLTGVAASALAAAVFSPAGLGGMIGTSLASSIGEDPGVAPADDPYAKLPAFPTPLSDEELDQVRIQLARTSASLEITRAATEAKIDYVRSIALTERAVPLAPAPVEYANGRIGGGLRLALSPVEAGAQPGLVPASYQGGGDGVDYAGSHSELADLMFAHENF
jgi:hypothetical protein